MSKKSCIDHLGNNYSSQEEMCNHYGISSGTFIGRIKRGYSLEEALTSKSWNHKVCDHLGNEFASNEDMAQSYGITKKMLIMRLHLGWTLEKALTTPHMSKRTTFCTTYKIKDHLGNKFHSIKELSEFYSLPYPTVRDRLYTGWSMKEALTIPIGAKDTRWKKCFDHLGNEYPNIIALCKTYNISKSSYLWRLKNGWTIEKTLTTPMKRKINPITYNGKKYEKLNDLLDEYDITMSQYYSRIKMGWTIDEIVNHKGNACFHSCEDHLGNKYESIHDRNAAYGLSDAAYQNRKNAGWSLEEILTIPQNMYIGEYRVAECLKRLNVNFYHNCTIKTIFNNFALNIDWNEFINTLQNNFNSSGYNWDSKKIQQLRPDFVIYTDEKNKICGIIEFDGEQHQNFVEYFFKTIEEFYKRCNIDFAKQSLWEYLNIPMLRIRHDQIDMIDEMIMDFIDNPQYYIHNHNTYLSETEYWSILQKQKEQINLSSTKTENEYLEENIDDDLER